MTMLGELARQAGAFQWGVLDTEDVDFLDEVRAMCESNTCRKYGTTWACPPAVGTVAECRERCMKYGKMLLFSAKYDLEDSFDIEGMTEGMEKFRLVSRALDKAVKPHLDDYLLLSNEGCGYCPECTYPEAPCRHPDKAHGSIEGYGIMVSDVARDAGMNYINGTNTVTYFGALFYNGDDITS